MRFIKKEHKKFNKASYNDFILGGDIGATNTHLGIFGVNGNSADLITSFDFLNKELISVYDAISFVVNFADKNYKLKIKKASFGIAGALSSGKDSAIMTNIDWKISKKYLIKNTGLKEVILINDFEAVGYAISSLKKSDVLIVKNAKKVQKAPILAIGAGTGLGKVILLYDNNKKSYFPVASEGGNTDFAAQDAEDFKLMGYIKSKTKSNASYEDVLSGNGLVNIYSFIKKEKKFKQTKYTKEIDKSKTKPELISKYRIKDKTCKETFRIFKKAYARFARNFALDILPYGGIYIAGGIAPKNKEIFDKEFNRIFMQNHKLSHVLKKIPIYLILNLNVGLIGAGMAGTKLK